VCVQVHDACASTGTRGVCGL